MSRPRAECESCGTFAYEGMPCKCGETSLGRGAPRGAPRPKAPRALRRLIPLIPRGEVAREAVLNGLDNELANETLPLDLAASPVLRYFEAERRQLGGDPFLDVLEEPDFEEDEDWGEDQEP